MRSWSPWFARRVNRGKAIRLPLIGVRIDGVDPNKITNLGWRSFIERSLAHRIV